MKTTAISIFLIAFAGCTAYNAQKSVSSGLDSRPRAAAAVNTANADPELVRQFQKKTPVIKQATLLSELDLYKTELASEGKYECCVSPGCNECPIRDGECHCKHTVAASGPCCGECTAAWIDGRGDIPGVDKEKVLASLGCVRELYEKKMPDEAAKPAAAATPATPHHH